MSVLDEVGTYLQGRGLGTLGTNLFTGRVPDAPLPGMTAVPDALCALVEYGGLAPMYTHDAAYVSEENPRLQFISRGARGDYQNCRALALVAWNAVLAVRNLVLSGTRYLWIRPLQSPFLIERDQNDRAWIGFNMQIKKNPS